MTLGLDDMKDGAERNGSGELVYEHEWTNRAGVEQSREINITRLLSPGPRQTHDVSILVNEAELAADDEFDGPDNPARPASQAALDEAVRELRRRGLHRAWTDEPTTEYPSR